MKNDHLSNETEMDTTLDLQNEVVTILEGTLGFLLHDEEQNIRRFVDENHSMTTERLVESCYTSIITGSF